MIAAAAALLVLLGAGARGETIPYGRVVDLTHSFDAQTLYRPGEPSFKLVALSAAQTPYGYYYADNAFGAGEHGGTHVDAPAHFVRGGKTVEDLDLERGLIGRFVVVDVTRWCELNPVFQARVVDFTDWERYHGRIPDGAIVLIRTGYGRYWPDRRKYLGTPRLGKDALELMRFPGLNPSAAKWLVQERGVAAVGIDTAGIDYGLSRSFESHQILLKAGVPVFENVADMSALPEKGGWLFALPMKIKGGTGAPLRLVAVLP